jgi:hypothetical protein
LGIDVPEIAPIEMPPVSVYPGLKPFVEQEERAAHQAALSQAEQRLAEAKAARDTTEPPLLTEIEQARVRVANLESGSAEQTSQALVGKQSLFLGALQGRRALVNPVRSLGETHDGDTITYELQLWADAHTNFQLGIDNATGATGSWVGFEQGRIISYRPKSFEIQELGRYNLAAGQTRFGVQIKLDITNNQVFVTVTSRSDNAVLCKDAPASLHGWNAANPQHGIFVDARPGSIVAYDEIRFVSAAGDTKLLFDFEEPAFPINEDVVGKQDWQNTAFSVDPATSMVATRGVSSAQLLAEKRQLRILERRWDALKLAITVAELRIEVARKRITALEARIVAGRAKFTRTENAAELARQASKAERDANHATAVANEQQALHDFAAIEGKPGTQDEISAAEKQVTATHAAAVAAVEALVKESDQFTLLSPTYPEKSTGRRAQLAYAIANRENPLTARVAINHIWMRHFGKPIVESVFDFGRNGKVPTQPELLDWLAVELMDNRWSMKHVHRLILTSDAYRRSSQADEKSSNWDIDAANRNLWRFSRQRVQAEVLRDGLLHLAGLLDPTQGGREIEHADAAKTRRRSLYISHHGEGRDTFLETFNVANPQDCYRRVESIVPQQALALSNGPLALETGRIIARRLWQGVAGGQHASTELDGQFVVAVFEHLLTRPPSADELAASLELLKSQRELFASAELTGDEPAADDGTRPSLDPATRARESLVHALFGHNDFISIR